MTIQEVVAKQLEKLKLAEPPSPASGEKVTRYTLLGIIELRSTTDSVYSYPSHAELLDLIDKVREFGICEIVLVEGGVDPLV